MAQGDANLGMVLQEVAQAAALVPEQASPRPRHLEGLRETFTRGQPLPSAGKGCRQLSGTSPLPSPGQQQGQEPLHSPRCSACGPLPTSRPGSSNDFHVLAPPDPSAQRQQPDKIQMG